MRRLAIGLTIGALALCAMNVVAVSQTLPVPLNEIMPRLPPVPEPLRPPREPSQPCRFSATIIPMGDVIPASRAERTSDGIALYGSKSDPPAKTVESPACAIPPD
jgi:hypothetical protein